MKIYTKTGDSGQTGLYRGQRVSKDSLRISAIGDADETCAFLGLVLTEELPEQIATILTRIQGELFCLGAELASEDPSAAGTNFLTLAHIGQMESEIDSLEERLPQMTAFILPGGSKAGGLLHVARAVCRRLERTIVGLKQSDTGASMEIAIQYVNRLSDLLFVMSRSVNQHLGRQEITWNAPKVS
ncbi:MAG: ATP:cob(I)alamin adenosyltransferase [Blastopirellula sp.]|nr:MAG: ATP:cob(I)alamin adenosyltransferase [Blastopirellula sp.]